MGVEKVKPTREQIIQGRQCWSPKVPEVDEQCASCPFREDLGAFHEVLKLVASANGAPEPNEASARLAAYQVKYEDAARGDFLCHLSVYESDYRTMKPRTEHRQCKGASDWYRGGGGLDG